MQKRTEDTKKQRQIHLSAKVLNLVTTDCRFNPLSPFCWKGSNAPQCRGSTLTNKTQHCRTAHTEKSKQPGMLKGSLSFID